MAIATGAGAVNLVPNPSFTDLYAPGACPIYVSQLALADKWLEGNNADPEYFHNCGSGFATAPTSPIATQPDASDPW